MKEERESSTPTLPIKRSRCDSNSSTRVYHSVNNPPVLSRIYCVKVGIGYWVPTVIVQTHQIVILTWVYTKPNGLVVSRPLIERFRFLSSLRREARVFKKSGHFLLKMAFRRSGLNKDPRRGADRCWHEVVIPKDAWLENGWWSLYTEQLKQVLSSNSKTFFRKADQGLYPKVRQQAGHNTKLADCLYL